MSMSRIRSDREGISLVEVIVTMVLLSIVLMALAPVLFAGVERQRTDAIRLERTGVLMSHANRLMAMPFGALDTQADVTVTDPYVHTYTVEIDVTGAGAQRFVKVKVTPSAATVEPDSVQFSRTQP
jgi:Tfp pilus assembly protein PilV